jgi:crotonobetainyl-CoA:carnitine CoA-transferase CaiB-like acyl-CoA transferase
LPPPPTPTPTPASTSTSTHAVPQGTYRGADGTWVAVSVATDAQRKALAAAAGWDTEDELATTASRRGRAAELDERLRAWSAGILSAEWVTTLRKARVPAAAVVDGVALVDHPQLVARERILTLVHPVAGEARYSRPAIRWSNAPEAAKTTPSPVFGQHNAEVLGELGYTANDMVWLADRGVIGDAPFGIPFARD